LSDNSVDILSKIIVHMKYAKYSDSEKRRETWEEICYRNRDMHINKYPELTTEIVNLYNKYIIPKKVLPSMRSAQFSGKPIELSPNRIYNCCFMPIDDYRAFSETMFLLLGGTGVGYSVQNNHVSKLPAVIKPTKKRRFLISDSIEGWADAVKALMKSYMKGTSEPIFDFSDIRKKGTLLKTSGGKAPGPAPLKECLFKIKQKLDTKENGQNLTSLEVHDIICYIADAVLAGGIRRAALISLFDMDDDQMLTCKFGNWWELNPQRGRANNSAVIKRNLITKSEFDKLWEKMKASGSGEPGIYFTNNPDWGTNPCCEIALRPFQFCNLTEVNVNDVESQQDLNDRVRAAAFLGTLQAGYTDFHYIRDIWKRTTEKDSLLGVSMTGIASGAVLDLNLEEASSIVLEENKRVSEIIGVSPAARATCVKPAGTTSLVIGSSSGIHAWHDPYYVRRVRVSKDEAIYSYLLQNNPEVLEDDFYNPNGAVISIPIKAPEKAIFRNESPLQLLERIKRFSQEWVKTGHIKGDNTHNVSATVSLKDDEWEEVSSWMWENRDYYNGLSILPYDGGSYKQAPFETISKEEYETRYSTIKNIDLRQVIEDNDNTDLSGELACAGGSCEIK
jgi:ribonucleoside-triphosphate reductase (thioredoxin)